MKGKKEKKVLDKVQELLLDDLDAHLYATCEELLNSGGVNIDKYSDDYLLPKILLTVALEREAEQVRKCFRKTYQREGK